MADLLPPYTVTSPAVLAAEALAVAEVLAPGITSLPANLIGDMNATSTGALSIINSAFVDLVNSISPYTANPTILYQLGNVYGVQQGIGSNTQVEVIFTGTVGFVINVGFVVSDGTYQYTVQDATIVGTGGTTTSTYCLATQAGTWAVPANTVTQLITSVPAGITLTVTNPTQGIPGQPAQSLTDYQVQVIQAGRAVATGLPTLLRTALGNVSGVVRNQVAIRSVSGGWEILVGGGDPYAVANAIYQSLFNINDLQGTQAFVGAGYISGTTLTITAVTSGTIGVGFTVYGAGVLASTIVTAASPTSPYTGTGGVGTYEVSLTQTVGSVGSPITINTGGTTEVISIDDFPDSYDITFVRPVAQSVSITVNWETIAGTNFVSNSVVASLVTQPLIDYINAIYVGQPISTLELQTVFVAALAGTILPTNLSSLTFVVIIDGQEISPSVGPPPSVLIFGNTEGYFTITTADVLVTNT